MASSTPLRTPFMPFISRSRLFTFAAWLAVAAGAVQLYRYALWKRSQTMAVEIDARLEAGDSQGAIDKLRRYLTILPSDSARLSLLARLLVDEALAGRLDRRQAGFARDTMRVALARSPEDRELREKLSLFLLAAGEDEAALRHLEVLRLRNTADPLDDDATRRIGILYAKAALANGKGAESYEMLRRLTDFPLAGPIPPGRREAFAMLAVMLAEGMRDPGAAQAVLERMTAAYPDDAEAWKILAAWHLDHRHPDEAADAATRAVALTPLDQGALVLDAAAALACGDRDKARAIVEGPLADAPLTKTLVTTRGALAGSQGDSAAMAAVLRAGIDALPEDKGLLAESLVVLVDAGRLDDAGELLPAARKLLGEESVPVLYAEATIDTDQRRWNAALRTWERLGSRLDGDPSRAQRIAIAIAACHAALGQTDLAADARSRAAATAPRALTTVALEAANLEERGQADEALRLLERTAASRPIDAILAVPAVWQPLLRLRIAAQGRLPADEQDWSAVEALLAAAESDPRVPEPVRESFRIAILETKRDAAAAIAEAEASVTERPDDPAAVARLLSLLARSGAEAEAATRLQALPDTLRDSPEVLSFQSALAASPTLPEAAALVEDVERRARSLPVRDAVEIRRRLALLEAAAGRDAEAERVALELVDVVPDDLQTWQLLLDLAMERGDAESVTQRARAVVNLAGTDSAFGKMARAARIVAEFTASRGATALGREGLPAADADEALLEAESLLAEVAREMPTSADAERRLAELATAKGDVAGAVGHFRRATALGEPVPWSRRRLATTLVAAGRYEESAPVIASLSGSGAGGASVGRLQADLLAARGRRREALELAARLTPPSCRDPDQLAWYAAFLVRVATPAEAEAACRRAIAAAPDRAGPRLTLLSLQWSRGQRRGAAATIQAAMAALPAPMRDLFEARAAVVIGREARLEERYRDAAATGDPAARRRLATWLLSAGRTPEAREELEGMVRDGKDDDETTRWARRRLATILAGSPSQGDLQEGLRLLAVDSDADSLPENTALAAAMLVRRGDPASWRRALALLDRIDESRGLTVDERVLRADVRRRFGGRQREQAREELEAIAATPDVSAAVLGMLVGMALEDDDTAAAGRWLDRLRGIAPGTPATLFLDTRAALAEGDHDRAMAAASALVPTTRVGVANVSEMLTRATLAEEAGVPAAATAVFAAAAELSVEGKLSWARFLGRRGRTDEAVAVLDGVRGRVTPATILDTLVTVAASADDASLAEALPRIDSLAAILRRENPGSTAIDLQLAILAEVIGRDEDAAAAYRALLADERLPPAERGIAAGNLALLLALPASAAEADALAEAAIAALGPLPNLLDIRALTRAARGDTRAALEDIADALLVPSARRFLHAAVVHLAAGDHVGARTALVKAEKLGLSSKRLSAGDRERKATVEAALAEAETQSGRDAAGGDRP